MFLNVAFFLVKNYFPSENTALFIFLCSMREFPPLQNSVLAKKNKTENTLCCLLCHSGMKLRFQCMLGVWRTRHESQFSGGLPSRVRKMPKDTCTSKTKCCICEYSAALDVQVPKIKPCNSCERLRRTPATASFCR